MSGVSAETALGLIQPKRKITGMSAILLPFSADHSVDWRSYETLLEKTVAAGLVPAVNMDTGYANLIDDATRQRVLSMASQIADSRSDTPFIAGAFVADQPGANFDFAKYMFQMNAIEQAGGVPIVFQSYGLVSGSEQEISARYKQIGDSVDRFLAFELGNMFADFGCIYSIELYQEILKIHSCLGAKHSSLERVAEWQRLQLRNQMRPEFLVLTGNDLAIDMVMYGSDYLLGLSAFAPDLFAARDRFWVKGDERFYELNDKLQYLGCFAFRRPTSAYKHTAAMFLKQRGWIKTDLTHPNSPTRPNSDHEILEQIGLSLGIEMER